MKTSPSEEAIGIRWASGKPLDPDVFDDAAVTLRAGQLVVAGMKVDDAITIARHELATWPIPGARDCR